MEFVEKEVYFDQYCDKCVYKDTDPDEVKGTYIPICHLCLSRPTNEYSHKPVYFKEKKQ